ncbi:MAG: hypothetical protein WBG50_20570 [Desulfomonilaceae bacterium]
MAEYLSDDLLAIMRIIQDKGGTHCSGSCHHRKPGELHCHTIGQELKISSSGVKDRILALLRMGLLKRERVGGQEAYPTTMFTISAKGKMMLTHSSDGDKK